MHTRILILMGLIVLLLISPLVGKPFLSLSLFWEPQSLFSALFWDLRLPRMMLVVAVGSSLAMIGGSYQSVFGNPLCDPYILGISSAVSLTVIGSWLFLGFLPNSMESVAMGAGAGLILGGGYVFLLRYFKTTHLEKIVLFGMGLNFILSSLLFMLMTYHQQSLGGSTFLWLFGHIPWLGLSASWFALASSLSLLVFFLFVSRALDALALGPSLARSLGFESSRWRMLILAVTSVFLGLMVSFTGAIGFVGLVVPHYIRLRFEPKNHRQLLVLSFLLGSAFLVTCDLVARLILFPFEFPIGMVTTLLGGPLFLRLLLRPSL